MRYKSAEISNFQDLEKLTAGLTLDGNRRNPTVSPRGMSTDPDGNARMVVDSYWNGSAVQPGIVFQQMYDVDRIEILRGAQGTLQGRTSPAGAIALYTRRPEMNITEGSIKTGLTDDGGFNTEVGLSLPLIEDELAVRFAANYVESEGQGIESTASGQEQDTDTESTRITLAWQPTDYFDATLIMEYADRQGDQLQAAASKSRGIKPGDRLTLSDGNTINQRGSKLTNLEMNLDVGVFTLTSVSGYIESDSVTQRDLDIANHLRGTALNNRVSTDFDSVTQELRLAPQEAELWDYVVGFYYAREDAATTAETAIFTPGAGISRLIFDAPIVREEYAAYLHNILHLTDQSQLQLGLRYQKVDNFNRTDLGSIAFVNDDQDSSTGEALTSSLKYQYNLSDDVMVYTGYEQSYRPGGISIGLYPLPGEELLYGEETSDSIELGLKSTLWDGRLQLNGAFYHQQFDDYIARATDVYVNVAPGFGNNPSQYKRHSGLTFNADAEVTGAEVDFIALLTEQLTLSGSISYNHAVFADGETGPCNGLIPNGEYVAKCDIGGNRIGQEPDWSASVSDTYLEKRRTLFFTNVP
ncbi:TonB-dependent receptor [Pseudomaricurvus alkylphenolicus]|uniref:TonB-dependent receptor n=1 Tax=Pseudomaricurvus alkylphenolicus TaxID=1306991 RepID=UPI00141E225F|nr:TonB-dependent receptor [Pseudomaricurvus alkylphenolicus]NIB45174.1 TonB-dependent receptor [Pseudomaricurvus alkylphenolicus]